jgi:hypothetical protein
VSDRSGGDCHCAEADRAQDGAYEPETQPVEDHVVAARRGCELCDAAEDEHQRQEATGNEGNHTQQHERHDQRIALCQPLARAADGERWRAEQTIADVPERGERGCHEHD